MAPLIRSSGADAPEVLATISSSPFDVAKSTALFLGRAFKLRDPAVGEDGPLRNSARHREVLRRRARI